MSRAMWKGAIVIGEDRVPIKLHAAAQDARVHFRLLHEPDLVPVRQRMVHAGTEEVVERDDVRWGLEVEKGVLVVLADEELAGREPEPSRDVEVLGFLPARATPPPFHERPYHLAPDGDEGLYLALAEALRRKERSALVRWVMRKKRYLGEVHGQEGRLELTTLRRREEVVLLHGLQVPSGRALDKQEKQLARQLVEALSGHYEPEAWQESYHQRVLGYVRSKAEGKAPELRRPKRKKPAASLARALRESVKAAKERDVA